MQTKVIVFDLGGTLMEYVGMPYSWVGYYKTGFEAVAKKQGIDVSDEDIEKSADILKGFNPRVNYREKEYSPEDIITKALDHWQANLSPDECIEDFFEGLHLKGLIYPDSLLTLSKLMKAGYKTATMTDLPTAMSEKIFLNTAGELAGYVNLYVSSLSCGFRKPNPRGLELIAEHFGVPAAELIFVGDEEKDRLTAENAGCRFIRINRKERKEGCIFTLDEIFEMI